MVLTLTVAFLTLSLAVSLQAQTVYDSLVNSRPGKCIVIYSGKESEVTARDIATNFSRKMRTHIGSALHGRDKVVSVSYEEFEKAVTTERDHEKNLDVFENSDNCVVVLDCPKDAGALPSAIFDEFHRLGGPVPLRPDPESRFLCPLDKSFLWSNLRAFNSSEGNVESGKFIFLLSAPNLEALDTLKGKLGESISDDRPPIFPDKPLEALSSYSVVVMPAQIATAEIESMPESKLISGRIGSLLGQLGLQEGQTASGAEVIGAADRSQSEIQEYGEKSHAAIVATCSVRKFMVSKASDVFKPHWDGNIELSIKLYATETGELLFDAGSIYAEAHRSFSILGDDSIGALRNTKKTSSTPSVQVSANMHATAAQTIKNALFMFELGLRGKTVAITDKLKEIASIKHTDWSEVKKSFSTLHFAVKIPEFVAHSPSKTSRVQSSVVGALTEAHLVVIDQSITDKAVNNGVIGKVVSDGPQNDLDLDILGKQLSADILISGESEATVTSDRTSTTRLIVKMVYIPTGHILAVENRELNVRGDSDEAACQKALLKSGSILVKSAAFWDTAGQNLKVEIAKKKPVFDKPLVSIRKPTSGKGKKATGKKKGK